VDRSIGATVKESLRQGIISSGIQPLRKSGDEFRTLWCRQALLNELRRLEDAPVKDPRMNQP